MNQRLYTCKVLRDTSPWKPSFNLLVRKMNLLFSCKLQSMHIYWVLKTQKQLSWQTAGTSNWPLESYWKPGENVSTANSSFCASWRNSLHMLSSQIYIWLKAVLHIACFEHRITFLLQNTLHTYILGLQTPTRFSWRNYRIFKLALGIRLRNQSKR